MFYARNQFIQKRLKICKGYFSVAFAFGIFAVENGLTIIQSVLVSLINQTSYSLKLLNLYP